MGSRCRPLELYVELKGNMDLVKTSSTDYRGGLGGGNVMLMGISNLKSEFKKKKKRGFEWVIQVFHFS